jgi:hypothetical protein
VAFARKIYEELTRRVLLIKTVKTILASTFLLFSAAIPILSQEERPRTDGSPPTDKIIVYAKIILPGKAPDEDKQPVESWIALRLQELGEPEIRVVTGWIRLPKGEEHSATIWNGVLDRKWTGCIFYEHVGELVADGKMRVTISGWAPFPPKIRGDSLPAEIGSRQIAVVDTGRADGVMLYVALMIAPAPLTNGEQDGADQPANAPESQPEGKAQARGESVHHTTGNQS